MKLLDKYPNQFKPEDFQHNKEQVQQLSDVSSNVLRNRIAGYITRYLDSRIKQKSE